MSLLWQDCNSIGRVAIKQSQAAFFTEQDLVRHTLLPVPHTSALGPNMCKRFILSAEHYSKAPSDAQAA
jgi:hypothetical protein